MPACSQHSGIVLLWPAILLEQISRSPAVLWMQIVNFMEPPPTQLA